MKMMKMNYHIKAWIIGLFVIITTLPAQSALCTYRQVVGSGDIDAANVNSPDSLDANITILMANPIGTIQCCGIIIAWEMYMEGPGWVIVQVWRRVVEENKYMLLGQNAVRHKSNGISKEGRSISNKNAIHVKPGDTIGFVQKDVSILRYTTCDPVSPTDPSVCAEDQLVNTNALEASIGDAVEFVTKQSTHLGISDVRGYALKAYMNKKSSVSCTDKHKTISDTLDVGEHVINLHVENMDMHDPDSSIKFVSNDQSLPVAIDSNTGEITVSGELSPDYPSTLYELTVEVYDSCSDSSSTCAINITVNNDPKPIIFNSLPSSIELSALETGHVYDFTISRQRDVDNVDCYVHSTFPDHATFDIRNRSKTDYSVYLTRTPLISDILQWSTYTVVLVISCESTEGQYNQTTLSLIFDSDKSKNDKLQKQVKSTFHIRFSPDIHVKIDNAT
ncbi:uncharacterized protein LOC132727912 [Ruditapes philippinarum]|uniref:uncharacterized protein LOC132727912 n=1 Tax=Ruditapes philippinarum TaxID=129788 RepID=UPI00295BC6A2|nr:uncharacterized protein LOC132727912 [Ruditapes philippinarum]